MSKSVVKIGGLCVIAALLVFTSACRYAYPPITDQKKWGNYDLSYENYQIRFKFPPPSLPRAKPGQQLWIYDFIGGGVSISPGKMELTFDPPPPLPLGLGASERDQLEYHSKWCGRGVINNQNDHDTWESSFSGGLPDFKTQYGIFMFFHKNTAVTKWESLINEMPQYFFTNVVGCPVFQLIPVSRPHWRVAKVAHALATSNDSNDKRIYANYLFNLSETRTLVFFMVTDPFLKDSRLKLFEQIADTIVITPK